MKNKKLIVSLFVLSLVLGTASALADSPYEVFNNIKIPAWKNIYTSNAHTKTETGNQYVKTIASSHTVVASTKNSSGVQSGWMTPQAGFTTWANNIKNGNNAAGVIYNLQLKHSSNILSGSYIGTWVLNPSYAN